jgi:KDO2-lipid IV(A) lauroyltransferase
VGDSERHRLVILPPIEQARSDDRAADVSTTTQRCNDVIEAMLRRHPDHWIWFHKRWRTRPLGEPRLY